MYYNAIRRHRNNLMRQYGDNSLSDSYAQAKNELFEEMLREKEKEELKREIIKELTSSIEITNKIEANLDEIIKKFFGGK